MGPNPLGHGEKSADLRSEPGGMTLTLHSTLLSASRSASGESDSLLIVGNDPCLHQHLRQKSFQLRAATSCLPVSLGKHGVPERKRSFRDSNEGQRDQHPINAAGATRRLIPTRTYRDLPTRPMGIGQSCAAGYSGFTDTAKPEPQSRVALDIPAWKAGLSLPTTLRQDRGGY